MSPNETDEKLKTPPNKSNVEGLVSTMYVHQKMFMGSWRDEYRSINLRDVRREHETDKTDYPKRKFRMIKRVTEETEC